MFSNKNIHIPEMENIMKNFPSWINPAGLSIFAIIIVLIYFIGGIKYKESTIYPVNIIYNQDSLIIGEVILPGGKLSSDIHFEIRNKNAEGSNTFLISNYIQKDHIITLYLKQYRGGDNVSPQLNLFCVKESSLRDRIIKDLIIF